MKHSHFSTVLRKELLDMSRDKRALLTNLILPLVLYPLMFLLMGGAVSKLVTSAEDNTRLAMTSGTELYAFFESVEGLRLTASGDPLAALERGEADTALLVSQQGGKFGVQVVFDSTKTQSVMSAQYVTSLLSQYNELAVRAALAERGITIEDLTPVLYAQTTLDAATGQEEQSGAGMMMSMVLPMLVVVFLAVGGLATAGDLFAGEKERKTMEPLLCTRAGRGSILGAKFTAVTVYALLSVVATLLGLAAGYIINPQAMNMGVDTDSLGGFSLSPLAALLVFVLIAVMAMVFSGLHAAISTYSRTVKEAATYGTFFMLASYVPAFSTMLMQAGDIQPWMMFVPALNVVGSLKMVLGGVNNIPFFLGAIASSLVFLALVLLLTRSLFKKESVMLRTTQ
jgi:sodium transport system permease protein